MISHHTPGPWKCVPDNAYRNGSRFPGFRIDSERRSLMAWIETGDASNDEAMSNARLMASAPDMLAALMLIAGTDYVDAALDPQRAVRVAQAAIAKATGVNHD